MLTFSYPSRPSHLALNQLSISIDDGKIIALVGPSGAGKSTIFSLIQRFYDPQSGSILFGKHDLRALDLRELRKEIAVVEQQPTLFTGSVMYNIKYGRPEASDDEAIEVAKLAYADEFIRDFPEGYDSNRGKGVQVIRWAKTTDCDREGVIEKILEFYCWMRPRVLLILKVSTKFREL